MYDSVRKVIQITAALCEKYEKKGWRQKVYNVKKIKKLILKITRIKKRRPKKEESIAQKENDLNKAYKKLIKESELFILKAKASLEEVKDLDLLINYYIKEVNKFINFAKTFIDQINRRVLKKEKIPHEEKIFSVFETHTEWICKGKAKTPFELGKRVAVVEDQYGFILSCKIMDKQTDEKIAVEIIQKTKSKFTNLSTCSFDRGFYSKDNRDKLSQMLDFVVMPKKGKLSKKDKQIEYSEEFKKYKKKHSAIESAINALEVHGLDKCLDKGFFGFQRYVFMAVVSRNIQKIGAFLKAKKEKRLKAA